jgi:capsular polysaccharide biosynthesis protein
VYIDLGDLCLSLAAFLFIWICIVFIKAIVDVYILKKCDCPKDYDGSCLGGHQEYY